MSIVINVLYSAFRCRELNMLKTEIVSGTHQIDHFITIKWLNGSKYHAVMKW